MDLLSLVCAAAGSVLAVLYITILLPASEKYEGYVAPLKESEHLFKPLYVVGFYVLEKINYRFDSKLDKQRFRECRVIYGEKYGEYYFRVNYAAKVGVGLFVLPFAFLVYPIAKTPIAILVGLLGVYLAYWNYDMKITDVTDLRKAEIERDFPEVLSKITLLVNAGMIMTDAWEKVSETGDSTIYKEMKKTVVEMRNGVSEIDALLNFGIRCMDDRVKKFSSILVQNLTKGNRELVEFLKQQTEIQWEEKKHAARRQGEAASSLLMLPIGLMFIGILVMVVVPVFANLSF